MGVDNSVSILVFLLAGGVSIEFTGERPQLVSFLFAPILVYLLEDLRKACSVELFHSSKIPPQREISSITLTGEGTSFGNFIPITRFLLIVGH